MSHLQIHYTPSAERNRVDNADQGMISVELTLATGDVINGKIVLAAGRTVIDFLNGTSAFVEFEPYDGERAYFAKSTVRSVRVLQAPRAANLSQKLRDLDGFDPWQILGLERGTGWDEIRLAYYRLAKIYHPDRYATAELPDEVVNYLSGVSRRINAAHAALEASQAQKRQDAGKRQEAIYTSPAR